MILHSRHHCKCVDQCAASRITFARGPVCHIPYCSTPCTKVQTVDLFFAIFASQAGFEISPPRAQNIAPFSVYVSHAAMYASTCARSAVSSSFHFSSVCFHVCTTYGASSLSRIATLSVQNLLTDRASEIPIVLRGLSTVTLSVAIGSNYCEHSFRFF